MPRHRPVAGDSLVDFGEDRSTSMRDAIRTLKHIGVGEAVKLASATKMVNTT